MPLPCKFKKPLDQYSLIDSGGNTPTTQGFMRNSQVGCFKKIERKFDPQRSVMMGDEDIESEDEDENFEHLS